MQQSHARRRIAADVGRHLVRKYRDRMKLPISSSEATTLPPRRAATAAQSQKCDIAAWSVHVPLVSRTRTCLRDRLRLNIFRASAAPATWKADKLGRA